MDGDMIKSVEEFVLARLDAPPYVLILSGLLIALTSGLAFYVTFRIQMALWQQDVMSKTLIRQAGLKLITSFVGIAGGLCIFLAALLMTAGISIFFACIVGFLATVLICYFAWLAIERKINRRLVQLYLAEQL